MAYGQIDSDKINTSVANTSLGAGNATRFKNRIINGDMRIDQRNAGASITQSTSVQYIVDRFALYGSVASKCTGQQNVGAVTPPAGFKNYIGVTSSSAYTVGSSEQFLIWQRIEGNNVADLGWGTANAKAITLSFWVRSSLTGTFGGVFKNSAGNRSYPFTYTINAANTWELETITIAGDTSGTWLTDTGIGINVYWGLGVGSTLSGTAGSWSAGDYSSATGATSVVGTAGATFYITGVQLEVGSSATGFEYVDYTTQLAMCQRYYQKLGNSAYATVGTGIISNDRLATVASMRINGEMRTAPSVVISSLVITDRLGYDTNISTINGLAASTSTLWLSFTHSAAGTAYYPNFIAAANGTSGFLALSSEL